MWTATDFEISRAEREITRTGARIALGRGPYCKTGDFRRRRGKEASLLFMSGSVANSAPWYSQRVRQEFLRLHANTPGVSFVVVRCAQVAHTLHSKHTQTLHTKNRHRTSESMQASCRD